MKKSLLLAIILAGAVRFASAQLLPSFQFGVKGGVNLSELNFNSPAFNSSNRSGYLGGFWARVGALGFNFQPEIYLTSKSVDVTGGGETKAKLTSIDVPLLIGGKVGAFGFGARFYIGPLLSFAIDKNQTYITNDDKFGTIQYDNQNLAWQFGIGLDIRKLSIDLRYEAGITKQTYNNSQGRINLFNLTLAIPLFKI